MPDIGARVDAPAMERYAMRFKASIQRLFGGYMRQPIYVNDQGSYLEVSGGCVLRDGTCSYRAPQDGSVCYSCPTYLAKVEGKK